MKKIFAFFMILFVLSCIWCGVLSAAVSTTASANRIPRGQQSVVSVRYNLTGIVGTSATSAQGVFRVGSAAGPVTVGTVNRPIIVNGTSTSGTSSGSSTESVDIPISVLEQVIARGTTRFYYERTFVSSLGSPTGVARVDFQIISESTADLFIKNIDLYFENRRPEVTIERGHKGLKTFADISYAGTGLFEGYWEVDGRVISRVFQQLSFGGLLKLQTPDIPELPTFDPGTHRIRFVVTRPTQPLLTPVVIYFVNLEHFKPALSTIGILSPQDKASIGYGPQKFEWQRPANAEVFLVQYGDKLESKAIFSAYTRDAFYALPDAALKTNFKAGERYYWKVIGFDDANVIIGESPVQSLIFKTE